MNDRPVVDFGQGIPESKICAPRGDRAHQVSLENRPRDFVNGCRDMLEYVGTAVDDRLQTRNEDAKARRQHFIVAQSLYHCLEGRKVFEANDD